ncbi:MAG TPA: TolC family protein [Bacteroidales bacterium]|nr:TolC family protein [Bacteroidales bacterium]
MKKIKHKIAVICLISIYINLYQPISILSQDSLTLYLEIAIKNNPTVLQRYAEYEAALQKVPQAGSLPDPELTAGIFLSPMEVLSGKQVAEIRLMQMFPWFGVLKNAKDEMSLMAKAKYETFRDAQFQVVYDLQRTWYELLKTQQIVHIAERNADILRTLERLSLVKFKAPPSSGNSGSSSGTGITGYSGKTSSSGQSGMGGMGGNLGSASSATGSSSSSMTGGSSMESSSGASGLADIYRIQIDISELENNIALQKSQQVSLKARLNSYLNRNAQSPVILTDTLVADTLQTALTNIPDSMLLNNPMLGMLQYEQQSYDARKKMVTRMGFPMVGLGMSYTLINKDPMSTSAMNGEDMIMPMVTITLPIYRKKYKSMQKESERMMTATKQNYQATSNDLQASYAEAIQLYGDAKRRIKLYKNQSLLAKKSFDIMVKSFSVSGSALTDVLRVRQQMLDYETKQTEAVADYNTAIALLRRLAAFPQAGN